MNRREVRVAEQFFDRLDELFPNERSPTGGPSATDFLLHEMPHIIDRLAEDLERSTHEIDGAPTVRTLVTSGSLVRFIAIYVTLAPDGSVSVIWLDIDR